VRFNFSLAPDISFIERHKVAFLEEILLRTRFCGDEPEDLPTIVAHVYNIIRICVVTRFQRLIAFFPGS
jgi:hypothetical protein